MDHDDRRVLEHVQRQFELLRRPDGDKRRVLADLFTGLNYRVLPHFPPPIANNEWSEAAREAISDETPYGPAIIAEGGGGTLNLESGESAQPGFKIIYVPLRKGETQAAPLRLTDERIVVDQLMREGRHPEALIVFSDPQQQYWHFVNIRRITQAEAEHRNLKKRHLLRRIAVGPEDKLGTAIRQFAQIALPTDQADSATAQQIQERHNEAFNVEQVTRDFFAGFKDQFFTLERRLLDQVDDREWAHDYALRLLSRLMFIYFIQRKRWINDDPDFMTHYWHTYLRVTGGNDTFFEDWLKPLFFSAFQDSATASQILRLDYMPQDIKDALRNAPYLNGGLFAKIKLDADHEGAFRVEDSYFDELLHTAEDAAQGPGFLERYNFTISEDSPLDQEVAVDPEMIGRVYESLVNISEPGTDTAEDRSKQREAGIFYTPRTEIDLMCRLALSDYLRNHVGGEHRDLIYQVIFSLEPDEKREADQEAAAHDLWPRIAELLERVTVVDPACGSGSFLVGMMNILADLRMRSDDYVGRNPTLYALNREIVRTSLYGVDVMDWACHVAELRLWLQLMIHADPQPGELRGPRPLLPNLSLKIRQGDSLVQELGGVNLAHLQSAVEISQSTKSDLRRLRVDKLSFYDAANQNHIQEAALRAQEQNIFLRICAEKRRKLQEQIEDIDGQLALTNRTLMGEEQAAVNGSDRRRLEARRAECEAQAERLEEVRLAIGRQEQLPFIWDLAFVEIFSGDSHGFDIVIGNPPYVRQEKIADPQVKREQSRDERGLYKQKLQRSVHAAFPEYFLTESGRPRVTIGARSDLYIYFYFHALSLLNSRGAFCFVTSNSWLDVGYGKELQEFLSRQVPIHMILDNQVKRSFANADVNTVIALFGAPRKERDACLDHTARFVMAQVPFEQMLHPVLMIEIDEAEQRTQKQEYRVFPRTQRELLEEGIEAEKAEGNGPLIKIGSYGGDKWGGKYLRAPEVWLEVLDRSAVPFRPLVELCEIRYGDKTGLTDFFYLSHEDKCEWSIEDDYLRPMIVSTQSLTSRVLHAEDTITYVFVCQHRKAALRQRGAKGALDYIKWGETQRTRKKASHSREGVPFPEVPSVRNNDPWYALTLGSVDCDFAVPALVRERYFFAANPSGVAVSNMFYVGRAKAGVPSDVLHAVLNTALLFLQMEFIGRTNIGGRLNFYMPEFSALMIPDVTALSQSPCVDELRAALVSYSAQPIQCFRDELQSGAYCHLSDVLRECMGVEEGIWSDLHQHLRETIAARVGKEGSFEREM